MAALSRINVLKISQVKSIIQHSPRCNVSFFRKAKRGEEDEKKKDTGRGTGRLMTDEENRHTTKHNLNMLKSQRSLDTKKGYKPPSNVRQVVEKVVTSLISSAANQDLSNVSVTDPKLKYEILSRLIREFEHDVPSATMSNMTTADQILSYFETEVRCTSSYEDLKTLDLPKNLHIQLEALRFEPASEEDIKERKTGWDAIRSWEEEAAEVEEEKRKFPTRTAYPGRDTIVTSIRYKRKYKDIKTVKPEPGYVNYYHGF